MELTRATQESRIFAAVKNNNYAGKENRKSIYSEPHKIYFYFFHICDVLAVLVLICWLVWHFLYSSKKFALSAELTSAALTSQRNTASAVTTASNWSLSYIRDNGQISLLLPKNKKASVYFLTQHFTLTFKVVFMKDLARAGRYGLKIKSPIFSQ